MISIGMRAWGSGDHAWVLCHGWGFDNKIWDTFIPKLQQQLQISHIIAVDLPGFGETPYQEWSVFKDGLLRRLPEKLSLLGWSLGGLYATRLAIESPERIRQLVNIATSPYFVRESAWPGITRTALEDFYTRLQNDPVQTKRQFVASQMGCVNDALLPKHDTGLTQGLDCLQHWDLRQALLSLSVPTHYVFGRLDTIVPQRLMVAMQKRYPHFSYHLLSHAAHMPFLSHPDALLAILEKV